MFEFRFEPLEALPAVDAPIRAIPVSEAGDASGLLPPVIGVAAAT
jgi:hypothetical protein